MITIKRAANHKPGACWYISHVGFARTVITHISIGRPIWWRPDVHRKSYGGITEWGAGWLPFAVQITIRPAADGRRRQ